MKRKVQRVRERRVTPVAPATQAGSWRRTSSKAGSPPFFRFSTSSLLRRVATPTAISGDQYSHWEASAVDRTSRDEQYVLPVRRERPHRSSHTAEGEHPRSRMADRKSRDGTARRSISVGSIPRSSRMEAPVYRESLFTFFISLFGNRWNHQLFASSPVLARSIGRRQPGLSRGAASLEKVRARD